METSTLLSLLEDLEEDIDDLEESLEPLFAAALSVTTKKLPLLDRAKLYTLIVYSIESLLFSYLRLNGVQAKEHAVFKELTRVKQYFAKIKLAEEGPAKPTMSLNKQATGRFIKQALAGNDRYDTERAEREAREKLLAARKSRAVGSYRPTKDPATPRDSTSSGQNEDVADGEVDDGNEEMVDVPTEQPRPGKRKRRGKNKDAKTNSDPANKTVKSLKQLKRKKAHSREEDLQLVEPG